MYQTNLSYLQMETYLSFLSAQGLIELNSEEFQATPKGQRFLEAYISLKMLLDDKPEPLTIAL